MILGVPESRKTLNDPLALRGLKVIGWEIFILIIFKSRRFVVKDEFLSNHVHLDLLQPRSTASFSQTRSQELRNPQKGGGGGGQSSICQNFIFNPELHSSNQLSKKQSTCPVLHLFSCQFCGCSLCVSRNEGLCINTTVEQGAYFFPHL